MSWAAATNTPDKIVMVAQEPEPDLPVKVSSHTAVTYWYHAAFVTYGPYDKPVDSDFYKNGFWTKQTKTEVIVEENVKFS